MDQTYINLRPKYCFTVEKKKKILLSLWDKFLDINNNNFTELVEGSCKENEINLRTFWLHYANDEEFQSALTLLKRAKTFQIESKLFEFAQIKSQFMDRIALMRAYLPELYGQKPIVNIDIRQLGNLQYGNNTPTRK